MPVLPTRNDLSLKIKEKIERLEQAVSLRIVSGFTSSVLGSSHFYPSKLTDQSVLIGAAASGSDRTYPCVPVGLDATVNSNWIAPVHTSAQLVDLLNDGADVIQALKVDFRSRINAAYSAQSESDLNLISEIF